MALTYIIEKSCYIIQNNNETIGIINTKPAVDSYLCKTINGFIEVGPNIVYQMTPSSRKTKCRFSYLLLNYENFTNDLASALTSYKENVWNWDYYLIKCGNSVYAMDATKMGKYVIFIDDKIHAFSMQVLRQKNIESLKVKSDKVFEITCDNLSKLNPKLIKRLLYFDYTCIQDEKFVYESFEPYLLKQKEAESQP